ncbi:hypothetical protein COT75_02410 [Candidatus Beckwithbacteria bacterium CG10_big_fil_rev_8_21_14_0_10_34_10]|uniref:Peptidase M20 dimerisation domain-containing protein n=1 Tax=Candidatus Beckwithbacteria bacterium CG10_big_fil_rev_8_21_14_0_10_34_10 TaxID=1974495 RepID=A0A2H0W9N1_9BACT|nr:MAG: hypothetical protein COT75_02410 [Candidatus Beckwithbacteria bacterium CG10_big_fil_rev_8_21_14_0_10_34_10]
MNLEKILSQLVAIPSIFPQERKIGEWIEGFLLANDWRVRRQIVSKNRFNLLAEKGRGLSSLAFYGHLDTVPVYGRWKTDPFKLTFKNDRFYGLGSADMKAGLAVLLWNSLRVKKTDPKIKLLFGVDEENISLGAHCLTKKYKKYLTDVAAVFVPEPGMSKNISGGANVLTLGRRGRVVYKIKVYGKSVHGADPQKGVNAISQACQIVWGIEKMKLVTHKRLGQSSIFVRLIYGETKSLSLPQEAVIEVDKHLVVPETETSVLKDLRLMIKRLYQQGKLDFRADKKVEIRVKKRTTSYLHPYITDRRLKVVKETEEIIKEYLGKVKINYGLSVADENVLAKVLKKPVITLGPQGGNEHSANEWVLKKSLSELGKIYQAIFKKSF